MRTTKITPRSEYTSEPTSAAGFRYSMAKSPWGSFVAGAGARAAAALDFLRVRVEQRPALVLGVAEHRERDQRDEEIGTRHRASSPSVIVVGTTIVTALVWRVVALSPALALERVRAQRREDRHQGEHAQEEKQVEPVGGGAVELDVAVHLLAGVGRHFGLERERVAPGWDVAHPHH